MEETNRWWTTEGAAYKVVKEDQITGEWKKQTGGRKVCGINQQVEEINVTGK